MTVGLIDQLHPLLKEKLEPQTQDSLDLTKPPLWGFHVELYLRLGKVSGGLIHFLKLSAYLPNQFLLLESSNEKLHLRE